MKKLVGLVATLLAALTMVGCATTSVKGSGIKGAGAKVKTAKRVIVDYQGATLGKEIPAWVELLVEGQYSQKVLSKVMPDLAGKKVFVTTGRGDNLDFVQNWVDLVQIETEVAGTLERVAGKAIEYEMKGQSSAQGKKFSPTELEKTLNMYNTSLTTVRMSGLERTASYWVETEVYDKTGKKVTDDYFEYYAVWTMDEKLFDKQLDEAMSKIDDTTTEGKELKALVKAKLKDSLAISNDAKVTEEADKAIISEKRELTVNNPL